MKYCAKKKKKKKRRLAEIGDTQIFTNLKKELFGRSIVLRRSHGFGDPRTPNPLAMLKIVFLYPFKEPFENACMHISHDWIKHFNT